MDSSDKSLVESHILGQKAAFAELVRRHGDALLRYLYRTTGNRQTAEDLFQETFRRVHEKANSFNGNNFRSWLYAIATNLAINEFRKRKRRPEISLEHIAESKNAKCENGNCQFVETLTANEKTEPGANPPRRTENAGLGGRKFASGETEADAGYGLLSANEIFGNCGCLGLQHGGRKDAYVPRSQAFTTGAA